MPLALDSHTAAALAVGAAAGAALAALAAWAAAPRRAAFSWGAAPGPHGGRITLAGCGPGDPRLLTLAAHAALADADVVISDLIAPPALRALAPARATFFIADKVPGNADSAQASVNAWALEALRRGANVVRLKAGDPFLYGRGGEEVVFFARHGYTAAVIPGVCTATAAPLLAGIPVTHRGSANQVLVSTGQGRGGSLPPLSPFVEGRTLVLLMAVARIPRLAVDLADYVRAAREGVRARARIGVRGSS
jgi:uroporphyrin-III C-methyltransferase